MLAALLLFFFLFGFRAMMVEGKRFRQACRESYRLLKGRRRQVARTLLFTCLAVVLALLAVYLVLVLVTAGITALQFHGIEARSAFQLNYLAWSQLLRVSSYVVLAGWYFGISTLLYHRLRHHHPHLGRRRRPFVRLGRSAALLCLLGVLAYFSETELGGAVFRSPEERIQVVAHRGGAALEPENTVAALQEAIVSGAEQAEIDIQQTKDGVLVVLHDPNLKRIGGVDRPIWEMTYADLRELPLREPIPTLEEAMQAVDGKLKLMIEIKVTGHEENLVRQTLGTIRRYEAEDWCCIGSMNLNTLGRSAPKGAGDGSGVHRPGGVAQRLWHRMDRRFQHQTSICQPRHRAEDAQSGERRVYLDLQHRAEHPPGHPLPTGGDHYR